MEILAGHPCERYGTCECMNPDNITDCVTAGFCDPVGGAPQTEAFGLRVSKGHGKREYGMVRVSVITQSADPPEAGFFDYSGQFKFRWTKNYVHTALKKVTPGQTTSVSIGGKTVELSLPKAGDGAAGVLIGDPCVKSASITSLVGCEYGDKFQTGTRSPALLNAFVGSADTDFWGILGDNFYDRTGEASSEFFAKLRDETKSKPFLTVPGNHDYWVLGEPAFSSTADQCGNGHMQFYVQDSEAAATVSSDAPPFNYSVDPSAHHFLYGCSKASPDNSRFYHQIGNVGVVAQSGAFELGDYHGFMSEACRWLASTDGVDVGLLVGHWDTKGMGVGEDMDVPEFYDQLVQVDGCKELAAAGNLKFFMGHTHCNVPHPHGHNDTGFMVAGQGMEGCGNYGIPVFDTTDGRTRVHYFDASTDEKYNATLSCVGSKGWRACLDLAETWLDQPRSGVAQLV